MENQSIQIFYRFSHVYRLCFVQCNTVYRSIASTSPLYVSLLRVYAIWMMIPWMLFSPSYLNILIFYNVAPFTSTHAWLANRLAFLLHNKKILNFKWFLREYNKNWTQNQSIKKYFFSF